MVVADNDESGTGERIAKQTGLPYWMPPDIGFDFNDYHIKYGLFKASQAINKLLLSK
jgi:putative DNA primase/helicase